jgi:hypothetical protein
MRALLLVCLVASVVRAEETGTVCLLKASWEYPKGALSSEHAAVSPVKIFTVQFDEQPPLDVTTTSARVDRLSLAGTHRVRVFADGKPTETFSFSFEKKGSSRLTLRYHEFYRSWALDPSKRECPPTDAGTP